MKTEQQYPEHVKLRKIVNKSQVIGEFLEWLENEGMLIGMVMPHSFFESIRRVHTSKEKLLAEYFEIDLDKIDNEKAAMLQAQRELNEGQA